MIRDKKGLSEVVTTLIIILLVLVAIGIVWVVVSGILQSGAGQTEINAKCLQVDIKATAVNCDNSSANWTCNVTYKRNTAGGDVLGGVVIVLNNGQSSSQKQVSGDMAALATVTQNFVTDLPITAAKPNKAEIAAYYLDASNKQQTCSASSSFSF